MELGTSAFERLVEELTTRLRGCAKIAILGVGSRLRGDDAVGVRLARRLRRLGASNTLILDCSTLPEGFTDKVKRFKADHVVVLDAVHAGLRPGSIVVLDLEGARGLAYSTHSPSLRLLATYLKEELKAKSTLVGIQVKHLGLTPRPRLSKEVASALKSLEEAFEEAFRRLGRI